MARHLIWGMLAALTLGEARAADLFRDRVAPLLEARCLACHDGARKRGGLDLSRRAPALAGGESGPALVPGQADRSRLVQMVSGPSPRMPRAGGKLAQTDVDALREWIAAGAAWPADVTLKARGPAPAETWWSLAPLSRPPVPPGPATHPVDRFVAATLEAQGLTPSPEADRLTLIRRLTFDLHGLPPTPEEVAEFLADDRPDAYPRLVDRLLASPRYGERWARHWLDVAHYGDTHGYDKDKRRNDAWPYRDWVIGAFGRDLPYSRFIEDQVAGDFLRPADPEAVAASGFVTAGPWDFVGHAELREGTVDKEKTRSLDRDDMVSSTLTTFTSLTVGCARCHDHKFDPISQKEYYRLQAVFAGVERGSRPLPGPDSPTRARTKAERDQLAKRRADLERRTQAATSPELVKLRAERETTLAELKRLPAPAGAASPSNGWHSGIEPRPDVVKWVQVDLGSAVPLDRVRLLPARPTDFRDAPGFGFPARFRVEVSDEPTFRAPVVLDDRTAKDVPNPGDVPYVVPARGVKGRYVRVTATRLWERTADYIFALAELQAESGGRNVALGRPVTSLDSIEAGRWGRRFLVDDFDSRRALPGGGDAAARRDALAGRLRDLDARADALVARLVGAEVPAELARVTARLAEVDAALKAAPPGPTLYGVVSIPPRPVHVLKRGDVEQPGPAVPPGALSCVAALSPDFAGLDGQPEGARRAALARWIADPANPLTWRSAVNRVWHYHFGRGLVDTPGDFGRNGSRPTHPDLLDWLAAEFRDRGSFKALHRLIVTSATYRQRSADRPEMSRRDADNRYLWRANRRRLDAEGLRDAVLTVSGRLDNRMGGPGYDLFRFKDDHSPIYDHLDPAASANPATERRTVYRFVVRSVPNPFLDSLDCADPNVNTPVRNATLTAVQALALLNNPFMLRQAGHFAERLGRHSSDPARQVEEGYRLAFGRAPAPEECDAVVAYARRHGLAAACRVLFNANEFVFVD